MFTFYRLIIERLQNGYKYALCNFYKNVNFLSFDINEEKGYNTNRQSEMLRRSILLLLLYRSRSMKPVLRLSGEKI